MGSPIGGGGPDVTTSIIPNPSASAVANNTVPSKGGIVAAGLDDAALKKLYASLPESQHSSVKVLPIDDDNGYVECYPLWGPPSSDARTLAAYVANRSTVIGSYEVDSGYCWDAQTGDCRAFLCAEGDDGWLVAPGILGNIMLEVLDACAPVGAAVTQSGAYHWNATGFVGGNVYVTLF
ncbi:hypothetical protein PG994_014188 [Apiospora phragmitis]|uniref:Uncharacterized protein n=1 Tax=Apiospora phragmitis TaxID=2905665 RepID=A0ABR1T564_9PEZI